MSDPLRVVLLAFDDGTFEPGVVLALLEEGVELAGIMVVPFHSTHRKPLRFFTTFLMILGPTLFVKKGVLFVKNAVRARSGARTSVENIARARAIPFARFDRVNSDPAWQWVKALHPDVILSHQPQVVRKRLLELPRLGIVNIHPGKLPAYRGPAPLFWALAHGVSEVGVTAHFMNEALDDGDIIVQHILPVLPGENYGEVSERITAEIGRVFSEALQVIARGGPYRPNHTSEGSYFTYPTLREAFLYHLPGGRRYLRTR